MIIDFALPLIADVGFEVVSGVLSGVVTLVVPNSSRVVCSSVVFTIVVTCVVSEMLH